MRARESLEFLLSGQEPPFEVRFRSQMGRPAWVESVEELLATKADYFGLVGRKRVRTGSGLGRENTAERTNLIWLDFDAPDEVVEREPLLRLAEQRLNLFEVLGLLPSAYHFSGQGSWAFWKLTELIPTSEAERLNKRMAREFRREGGSEWNADRVARLPGAWHQTTGLRAFVMALTKVQWSPSALDALLEPLDEQTYDDAALRADVQPGGNVPILRLVGDLAAYVRQKPTKAERRARGIDGSAVEQRIVCLLVNEGYSDGEIARYFDHHGLPRHREEVRRRRGKYTWLARGITTARRRRWGAQEAIDHSFFSPSTPPSVSERNDTYAAENDDGQHEDDYTDDKDTGGRHPYWYARRWLVLTQIVGDKRSTDLQQEIMARFDVGKSTAIRDINWLEARDYITKRGRGKPIIRTEKAHQRIAGWGQRIGVPLEFTARSLSAETVNKRTGAGSQPDEEVDQEAVETGPVAVARPRRGGNTKSGRAKARTSDIEDELRWQEIEKKRRKRSVIDNEYRISLLGKKRVFYLQLLTPPDEWYAVRFHEQVRVGLDDEGVPIYQSFVSLKDPSLDGPSGFDPIEERGQLAKDRLLACGAELEKTNDGFRLTSRFEREKPVANVGLIVQARFNFFEPLHRLGPRLTKRVLKVTRSGSGKQRMFQLEDAGEALPLDVPAFDLGALLDRLADRERLHAMIDPLPEDWRFF